MKIALDATPLIDPAGGLARYVTELALALALENEDDEIHLLSDQTALHIDERLREAANIRLNPPARWGRSKWWSLGLPFELKRRGIDVFHGTNFEIPYVKLTPAVMTVHDLSPWKPPPLRPPGCERVRSRTPRLVGLAQQIITPTEAVRAEVIERFGPPAARVHAIPHAPSDALALPEEVEASEIRQRLVLPARYLLAIGAGNERKNIGMLVEAWSACRARFPELGLAVIGAGASRFAGAADSGLRLIEGATDRETAAALSGAAAFVYPSLYEGFGLPLVEAMRAGVPVLASTDPALMETAAGAAVHFAPDAPGRLSEAIAALLDSPAGAARLVELGRQRAAELSWSATARATRAVYELSIGRR